MVLPFFSPRSIRFCGIAGPEEAKKPGGAKGLRLIQIRFNDAEFEKISPTWQDNSPVSASGGLV